MGGDRKAKTRAKAKKRKLNKRPALPLNDQDGTIPKSFIVRTPSVKSSSLAELVLNFRCVMQPNTAIRLKETRKNKLKDFVSVAASVGVTHFILFGQTLLHSTVRLAHFPSGPTVFCNVVDYSLVKDVLSSQAKPTSFSPQDYQHSPLVILNGFPAETDQSLPDSSAAKALSLTALFLQNMFPPVVISQTKPTSVRRVALFHYENGKIHFRHYRIILHDVGVSRPVRKILKASTGQNAGKKIAKELKHADNVADFILRNMGPGVDSEVEECGSVPLDQKAVKVIEMGPRMTLELAKIRQGFGDEGEMLYSKHVGDNTMKKDRHNSNE